MKPVVHILATVRKQELINSALLVFRTIRTGFPSGGIVVHGNNLDRASERMVASSAASVKARYLAWPERSHGTWIEYLIEHSREPFWIADTDLVFFEPVEHWFDGYSKTLFAGRYEPDFHDPWTKCLHVCRLHPSLMWFNPLPLRAAMRAWPGFDPFLHTAHSNLIQWNVVPRTLDSPLFYDTCAGLYHALGGTAFTDSQDLAFGHLFAGTYADLLKDTMNLLETHQSVCDDPQLAKWLLAKQREWYKQHSAKT